MYFFALSESEEIQEEEEEEEEEELSSEIKVETTRDSPSSTNFVTANLVVPTFKSVLFALKGSLEITEINAVDPSSFVRLRK
tara:strand:- start:558 stop:803 length:246 start_codon:yes stop_codon:yes gene_type:complete